MKLSGLRGGTYRERGWWWRRRRRAVDVHMGCAASAEEKPKEKRVHKNFGNSRMSGFRKDSMLARKGSVFKSLFGALDSAFDIGRTSLADRRSQAFRSEKGGRTVKTSNVQV